MNIKVSTYNIHSGRDYWMRPQLNKIIKFLKNQNIDIIGVQEINESENAGFQVSQIKNDLGTDGYFGENVKKNNVSYGIATFSFFPIIEKKHILFPGKKEQRGLIDTRVKIGKGNMHIVNTHLGLDQEERRKQFEVINEYVASISSPYVVMGDFNTIEPEIDLNFLKDSAKTMNKENLPTFIPLQKRIDYIYTSKDLEVIKYIVFPVYMSDHYPVMIDLKM